MIFLCNAYPRKESQQLPDHQEASPYWLTTVDNSAFPPPAELPASREVVVICGVIMGVSVAYWLSRVDVSTVLLEARELAAGATGRNAGLMLAGKKPIENPELVQSVLHEEGIEVGYTDPGHLALAASEDTWAQFCDEAL
jgi:hypothetical protein